MLEARPGAYKRKGTRNSRIFSGVAETAICQVYLVAETATSQTEGA
jgi:hypothetical protein